MLALVRLSYPWVWELMNGNQFPRAVVVGGRNAWWRSELYEFVGSLPRRRLKDDPPLPAAASDPPARRRRAPPARASTPRRTRSTERASMTE